MKNNYTLLFLLLLFIACTSLKAQRTFDSKKKKNISVNTSSLNATHIKYTTPLVQGRSITSNQFVQNRNFNLRHKGPHQILYTNDNTLPAFIETKRDKAASFTSARKDLQTGCYEYLKELQTLLKIDHPEENFIIQRSQTDKNNNIHIRLQQHYKGVPIYGAEIAVHLNANGEGESFNGNYFKLSNDINITPKFSDQTAIEYVKKHVSNGSKLRALTLEEKNIVQHAEPASTLCIYEVKGLVKISTLALYFLLGLFK